MAARRDRPARRGVADRPCQIAKDKGERTLRVLITGITGFAGSHLAEYLHGLAGVEVYGTHRWRSRLDNLAELAVAGALNVVEPGASDPQVISRAFRPDKVNLIGGDIGDFHSMSTLIAAVQPDRIFHLAAQSHVPTSWNGPAETLHLNIIGQVNLFEAMRAHGNEAVVQIAGSSEEYGLVREDEVPMTEQNPLRPLSPYAVSKVAQDKLAYQYHMSYGIRAIVTRGFNHCGPRQTEHFIVATLGKQIAYIEAGLQEPVLRHGDLTSKRDLTDVRDMVRAYWALLDSGEPGEVYNIGSGTTRTIREVLDGYLALTTATIDVQPDPARMRPSDVKILWADDAKFRAISGWEPVIPFEQTLRDTLDYWRGRAELEKRGGALLMSHV
jgi:GDP-4-dehydro-6-deoxy-D-mannose reductase